MRAGSKLCVVIPAYNAEGSIGRVVSGALEHIRKVIVLDDGSTDKTSEEASRAGADVMRVKKNMGKGNALRALFAKAEAEGCTAVISMDADGQHDPGDIPLFFETHEARPDAIIVGSRMGQRERIPRARYGAQCIARFFISIGASQFVEDAQSGFRLYPLGLIKKIALTSGRYITEAEILLKAGDMGAEINCIRIKVVYEGCTSHLKPVRDVTRITAYVISYVMVKLAIEGVSPGRTATYTYNCLRDRVGRRWFLSLPFQALTAVLALPFSIFCLLEDVLLSPFMKDNFASLRRVGVSPAKFALAVHIMALILALSTIEKLGGAAGIKIRVTDKLLKWFGV